MASGVTNELHVLQWTSGQMLENAQKQRQGKKEKTELEQQVRSAMLIFLRKRRTGRARQEKKERGRSSARLARNQSSLAAEVLCGWQNENRWQKREKGGSPSARRRCFLAAGCEWRLGRRIEKKLGFTASPKFSPFIACAQEAGSLDRIRRLRSSGGGARVGQNGGPGPGCGLGAPPPAARPPAPTGPPSKQAMWTEPHRPIRAEMVQFFFSGICFSISRNQKQYKKIRKIVKKIQKYLFSYRKIQKYLWTDLFRCVLWNFIYFMQFSVNYETNVD
jgi:hypothetical protein